MKNFISKINTDIDKILKLDFHIYLTNDILIKSDRSSMYYGLENRSPYLSKSIIKFSNDLPNKFKINNKISKYILRSILYKNIPADFFKRPKQGFSIPLYKYLKKDLRTWALNLLESNSIPEIKNYNVRKLWNVLMFESWYINYIKNIRKVSTNL